MKVGIFYGSTTGNTEQAAHKMAAYFPQADVMSVADGSDLFTDYDLLILGSSTWGLGDLQDDWDTAIDQLRVSELSGKPVAVFGLGDQSGYPDTFVDAMGALCQAAQAAGARLVGAWPAQDYDCLASAALDGDHFCGLALDEENQGQLSDERIKGWCAQLTAELAG